MREIDKIAENLFEKIRSRFDVVNVGDENAQATQDPEKARFFNFNYTSADGTVFGNVTVSLIDEDNLKVYFGKDVSEKLNDAQRREWYEFLRGLRMFAKRNMLNFDTRDIAKSTLQLRDVKQQSKADATVEKDEINVNESRMYGTSRNSFADVGNCKLRIIHSSSIDEEKHGARGRQIEAIFIETPRGERFRVDNNNLNAAAAIAQHLSQGGEPHDEIAEAIHGMAEEMDNMRHFVRAVKRRTDLDDETSQMAQSAIGRYNELKDHLKRIRHPNHYLQFIENFAPDAAAEDEYDMDALRERFVKKMYDDRFDQALPYVYRAHQKQLEAANSPMAEEFENWANQMVEGTWAVPDDENKVDRLRELMSQPLLAGINGQDATTVLYHVIGDDHLFDQLSAAADASGAEFDVRPIVLTWLQEHFPAIASEMAQAMAPQQPEPAPAEQPVPAEAPAEPAPEEQQMPTESADPLEFIRHLAGLRK